MVGFKWKRTVVTAFACASLAWAQSTQTPSAPTAEKPRTLTVQELGKAPDRCRVLRSWRESNGMEVFEVQSISTGERLTIVQSSTLNATPGGKAGSKAESMATRIYHWSGTTPPAGAPMGPRSALAAVPAAAPASTPAVKTTAIAAPVASNTAAIAKPTTVDRVKPTPTATGDVKLAQLTNVSETPKKAQNKGAAAVEPAQPSDWHKSWGKSTEGKSKAAPVLELPHADANRPDPLKEPQDYTRHAQDERSTRSTAVQTQPAPSPKSDKITVVPQLTSTVQPAPARPALSKAPESKIVAVPVDCNTTCVPCDECKPKFSLFRRATPCVVCNNVDCNCQPALSAPAPAAPVAQCPPQHAEPIEIVKNGNTLVDVWHRLRGNPPGVPTEWTPMDHGPTFQEKLQTAMAESQARREERAQMVAARKAALAQVEKPVATQVIPTNKPDSMPTGSQSVMAATEGMPVASMPVPVMIIPPVRNPQALRPPKKEAPPTETVSIPRSEIENAFTDLPPQRPAGAQNKQPAVAGIEGNAFFVPPESPPESGFGPMTPGAFQQLAGMYPGYGYLPSAMGMNPYAANPAFAYAARPPAGMMAQRMMVPGPVYVNDVNERMPVSEGKTSERQASQAAVDVPQMLTLLKSSLYPSHREWAADSLAAVDWRQNPQVVDALVKSAKEDAAATVRAGCVRGLGTMHANTPVVLATLQTLKADTAPQVVQEADRVLTQLGGK